MTKEMIGDLAVELDEKEQLFEVLESMLRVCHCPLNLKSAKRKCVKLRWRGVVFMIHENV